MKVAVVSDIHGNLESLEALLKKLEEIQPDAVACLGDVVGYGANPKECLETSTSKFDIVIKGNHERAVLSDVELSTFTERAKMAILWTREQLSEDDYRIIEQLPDSVKKWNALFVHGSPQDPDYYIINTYDAIQAFGAMSIRRVNLCFHGHTHIPFVWTGNGSGFHPEDGDEIEIDETQMFLINVGSVGQPRDGINLGSFVIWDTERSVVSFHRFEYDITTAASKIIQANLPESLARRLSLGI